MSITLSQVEFFKNGKGGVSKVVGVESGVSRVARYCFTAPSTGASSVRLHFSGMWPGNGKKPADFRFYITTDPDSHINAGASSDCTGLLEGSNTEFNGEANILLLPDRVYYLFIFPNTTEFGWYNWEGSGVLSTAGGSYSLPTVSGQTAQLGEALTVSTNPHSADFTHRLTYRLGQAAGLIAENVLESTLWMPPLELAGQLPNADKGICTLICQTYQGDQLIGTAQTSLTLCVPDSLLPTVTATWADKTQATALMGQPVQRISALEVSVLGQGIYGSTVASQSVFLNGQPYTGGTLLSAGEQTLSVSVTDSRGRTAKAEYPLTVAAYDVPELTLSAHRCTQDGTADDTGEFCLVTVAGSVHDLEGRNVATLRTSFASDETVAGDFEKTYLLSAPSTATLSLQASLTDALSTASRDMVLSVGYATMDFLKGGRGIAFGATATQEGFTCAMDARFLGSDLALADYVVEQGVQAGWHYRKWNSGICECWGTTHFSMDTTDGYSSLMRFPAVFTAPPVITYSHGGAGAFIQSCLANVAADYFQLRCTGTGGYYTDIPCYAHIIGTYKEE